MRDASKHSTHSSLREVIVEHNFVGQFLKRLWERNILDVEVLRSEFDAGGYDLVVTRGKTIRHVQLKTSLNTSRTRTFDISLRLAERESGCVLCLIVDSNLNVQEYIFFGGSPCEPLPSIEDRPLAKNVRADSTGTKIQRPGYRRISISAFERLGGIDDLIERLLGIPQRNSLTD